MKLQWEHGNSASSGILIGWNWIGVYVDDIWVGNLMDVEIVWDKLDSGKWTGQTYGL